MSEIRNTDNAAQANSKVLVTIGLPTYNRPAGLRKCLETILLQSYSNLEIIISDNCSTNEEVQKVITEFAAKDSRIKHFRQPTNIGLEENFNFVYRQASAAYFTWMSDDDYFDLNYIEACVTFLEKNTDYILCSGIAKYYSNGNFLFDEKMFKLDQGTANKRVLTFFRKAGKNGNFYGVFRNHVLQAKPLGEHVGCDWAFMAKLAMLGKLSFVSTTAYHRSADGNSGTRKKMVEKFKLNKFKELFFETYSAYEITSHIFNDKVISKKFGLIQRCGIQTVSFFLINWKFFLNAIKKRVGGATF